MVCGPCGTKKRPGQKSKSVYNMTCPCPNLSHPQFLELRNDAPTGFVGIYAYEIVGLGPGSKRSSYEIVGLGPGSKRFFL